MAKNTPCTGRDIFRIADYHDLGMEVFQDTVIYDLGCGRSNLESDLAVQGIAARVLGFDNNSSVISDCKNNSCLPDRIYADLDNLPAESESADVVLATYSLPFWAETTDEISRFFDECTRLVKTGGILAVYPIGAAFTAGPRSYRDRKFAAVSEAERIRQSKRWLSLNQLDEALTVQKLN